MSPKKRWLSALLSTLPVHRHSEADPFRKESHCGAQKVVTKPQTNDAHQILCPASGPPMPVLCAQRKSQILRRSDHMGATLEYPFKKRFRDISRIPGQAAIAWVPRWNFHLRDVSGTYSGTYCSCIQFDHHKNFPNFAQ